MLVGFPTWPFGWTVAPVTGEAEPQRDHVHEEVKTQVPWGHKEWAPMGMSRGQYL